MTQRYLGLDVARAVLAWSVVAVHVAYASGVYNHLWTQIGIWAVAGFLTMSGFVIGTLLLNKKERYLTFLFRRCMRLYPAFAVCLGIALVLRPLTVAPQSELALIEQQRFWPLLASHLAMLHGIWPHPSLGEYAFLPPAWSISLEWQCYLVAPLLLLTMLRYRARFIIPLVAVTLTIAGLQIGQLIKTNDGFLPMRLGFFVLGMTVALYLNRLPTIPIRIQWPRFLIWLGEISYSTYLIHWPLIRLLGRNLAATWSPLERTLYLAIASTPLIMLASFGLYELVEKPGINLGKIICNRLRQSRQRRDRLVDPVDL